MVTQLLSSIDMAFAALASNKTRALLTMLGIIIGVASVIALTAIGEGAANDIANRIQSMGTNLLQIDPAPSQRNGVVSTANINLTEKDVEALRRSIFLSAVEPSVDSRVQVIGSNMNWNTRVLGTTPNCLDIRNYKIAVGSIFTDQDVASDRKVCDLGNTVAEQLYGSAENAIGQEIRVGPVPMIVLGVLQPKGFNSNGFDQDDFIVGPTTTVQKRIMGTTWLEDIFVTTFSSDMTDVAIADVTNILRDQHRLTGKGDDFRVRSQVELAQAAAASSGTLTQLLTSAAIISLLVGGIGIMNIMLVSVTERTHEIGIRKSIGAKPRVILTQFLVEALTLSLVGGIIGVLVGVGASYLISKNNGWILIISTQAMLLSFLAATSVGLFFGFYPAKKASALDPIEALRYD
ncbi:MAG TPA: ABC transporter permease [Candidatus Kapabacteria bacterium]|nr:ABC transporter permease [Candidatus Kapabacteria bacterium]